MWCCCRSRIRAQRVPESERELVFQPFYRALGTEADGSGLGLPIVREIARQHGADVELADVRPGTSMPGARFTVRFAASSRPRSDQIRFGRPRLWPLKITARIRPVALPLTGRSHDRVVVTQTEIACKNIFI